MDDLFEAPEIRTATLSPCGRYRRCLGRHWDRSRPALLWIMLNPSTADSDTDDATIRRCRTFSRREGFGGLRVVNLFELRSTDPRALVAPGVDLFGDDPERDYLRREIRTALPTGKIVVAWGAHPAAKSVAGQRQAALVWRLAGDALHCLGTTKDGSPRHPVRLPNATPLVRWEG